MIKFRSANSFRFYFSLTLSNVCRHCTVKVKSSLPRWLTPKLSSNPSSVNALSAGATAALFTSKSSRPSAAPHNIISIIILMNTIVKRKISGPRMRYNVEPIFKVYSYSAMSEPKVWNFYRASALSTPKRDIDIAILSVCPPVTFRYFMETA